MKKVLRTSIVILLVLMVGLLPMTGCSKEKEPGTTTASGTTTAPAKTTTQEQQTTTKEKLLKKLTIFSEIDPNAQQTCQTLNDHEVFKELQKRTGVEVEWIHPTTGEQFALMIASGEYPDLIRHNWYQVEGGAAKYASDKVIINLNELIANHAPNLVKLLNEYPQIKRDIVDAEGDMYYVPHVVLTPENNIFKGPLIREDWLVKLGLEVPETVDELYNVLVAFRDGDPNGNNEKDEWAMSGAGAFTSSGAHSPGQLSWAWDTTPSFYLRDGKVQYGPLDPQFKDALAFMNKLYNEGLLDPDYIVMGRSQLDAKVMEDKVGFSYHYQPTNFMTLMADVNPDFKVVGIPFPKGPDGQFGVYDSRLITTIIGGGCIAISTHCNYPEEAMEWLDYAFSEEGNLLFNFGIEGQSYNMVNGEPVYTDLVMKNPDLAPAVALGKWSLSNHKWAIIQDVRYHRQYVATDYSRESLNIWTKSIEQIDLYSKILPAIAFTPAENETLASIKTEINTLTEEKCDMFVLGKENFDNYDAFIAQLKKSKVDDAIALIQTAYDRYISN